MNIQSDNTLRDRRSAASTILEYWFSTLDDAARLDRAAEPFRTCYQRWYGKDPEVDADIRSRFEARLRETTHDGSKLGATIASFRREAHGLVALVVLLDQMPRNMYRNTPQMYAHDPLALAVATTAIHEYERDQTLSLVQRMFLYVPLMHAENLTIQEYMLAQFDDLVAQSRSRSPHNREFFEFARDYARRHVDVVAKFGRFPHRNEILGRPSTTAEKTYLLDHPGF